MAPTGSIAERSDSARLTKFLLLAFGLSWAAWMAAFFLAKSWSQAAQFVATFGPSTAALLVVGRDYRGWLDRCFHRRFSRRLIAVPLAVPLVVLCGTVAAHLFAGERLSLARAIPHFPLVALNFLLIFLVGGPLGEELGWRGFALPNLAQRFGWFKASVGLGAIWALWHLPLFFLPGSMQSQMSFWAFALGAVVFSMLLGWMTERAAGSIIPAMIMHTVFNALPSVLSLGLLCTRP